MLSTFWKAQSIMLLIAVSVCIRGANVHKVAPGGFNNSQTTFQLPPPAQPNIGVSDVNSVSYGLCTHGWITMAAQTCESRFFRTLIEKPYGSSCSVLFKTMQMCINSKWEFCFPNDTVNVFKTSGLESVSLNVYSQSTYCNDGALSLPNSNYPINYCSPEYAREARKCLRIYHNKFRRNPRDEDICEEFYRARECWYSVQDELCEYEAMLKVLMDAMRQLYRCWNPFCVWPKIGESTSLSRKLPIERSTVPDDYKDTRQGIPKDCSENAASLIIFMNDQAVQSLSDMYTPNDGTVRKYKDSQTSLYLSNNKQLKFPSKNNPRGPNLQSALVSGIAARHFYTSRVLKCLVLVMTFIMGSF